MLFGGMIVLFTGCSLKKLPDTTNPANLIENAAASIYMGQALPQDTPEIFSPGLISVKGRFEMGFTMSPDGKTMAFGVAHESDTNQTQIYFMQRNGNRWSKPSTAALHNNANTFFPMFGPTGYNFYYSRAIPGADTDIWTGMIEKGKVSKSSSLTPAVNSQYREAGHGRTKDELFLFTSNRDQAQSCCGDVYQLVSTRNGPRAEKVESLSSLADEESLFLSPDGDYVIIQAWKPEHNTKHDLYISYRTKNERWTKPRRLPDEINGKEIEQRPFVSPDRQYLFFSRMSITTQGDQTLYHSDIFWVSMRRVFTPFVYNPVGAFQVNAVEDFTISLPLDILKNPSTLGNDAETLTMPDGTALPAHLSFDPKTRKLNGNMKGEKTLVLQLTRTDAEGQSATHLIEILADNS